MLKTGILILAVTLAASVAALSAAQHNRSSLISNQSLHSPDTHSTRTAPSTLRIIPTPKYVKEEHGALHLGPGQDAVLIVLGDEPTVKEEAAARYLNRQIRELYHLADLPVVKASALDAATASRCHLILIGNASRHPLIAAYRPLLRQVLEFLDKQATDQAYIVHFIKNPAFPQRLCVVLTGKGDQGTLYAAVTLGQMIRRRPGGWEVAVAQVRDYPDFTERWDNFPAADDALTYKITLSPYYSIGLASVTSLKAGERLLAATRHGRKLGVRPVIAPCHMDMGQQNRRSYPQGEIYECIGTHEDADRTRGFCPSNLALRNLKSSLLKDFVRRTEPSALYLHWEDYDMYHKAQAAWKNRCATCRNRWPSDELESAQGQAGAFAEVVNSALDAIFSVTTESGYQATRDCLIGLVLPPYTRWSEPDKMWDREVSFYVILSNLLRYKKNVQFILREQGPRRDGAAGRYQELRQHLDREGNGHEIWAYIHGGDRRTTWRNWPVRHRVPFAWIPSPVFSSSSLGASTLMLWGGANSLMKAEYAWNTRPANGYWLELKNFDEYASTLRRLYGAAYVPALFDPGKLFDRICQNLYGLEAGKHVAEGLRPEPYRDGVMFPVEGTAWLSLSDPVWSYRDPAALQEKWRSLFSRQVEVNRKALKCISKALTTEDLPPGRIPVLQRQFQAVQRGLTCAAIAVRETDYYLSLLKGDGGTAQKVLADLLISLDGLSVEDSAFVAARRQRVADARCNFDKHVGADRRNGTDITGERILIRHNAFTNPKVRPIAIRGKPKDKAQICNNWFAQNTPGPAALRSWPASLDKNVFLYNNAFGRNYPEIIE